MEKVLLLLLLLSLASSPSVFSHNVTAVFTFGDSIFDAGNNHFIPNCTAQADFPPYGSSFFHHPTGRFTNGRTVVDFICQFFLILLFNLFSWECLGFTYLICFFFSFFFLFASGKWQPSSLAWLFRNPTFKQRWRWWTGPRRIIHPTVSTLLVLAVVFCGKQTWTW